MLSIRHQGMVEILRGEPKLIVELLAQEFGSDAVSQVEIRLEPSTFEHSRATQYRADLVLVLSRDRKPALAVILEVQLRRDDQKLFSWPVYLATQRALLRCPVVLMVVCPDQATARWASQAVSLGPGGSTFKATAIGPSRVPALTGERAARASPGSAVFSALMHARGAEGLQVARAAIASIGHVEDEEMVRFWYDLIHVALPRADSRALEDEMLRVDPKFDTPLVRKLLKKGRVEGRVEGRAQGRAEGRAEALLALLDARGIRVPKSRRAAVRACTEIPQLDRWLVKAASATSLREVFGDE